MKTFAAKTDTTKRAWHLVDATDKVLGRLATEVARRLRGKHKAEFTPNVDTGDYVVVINAGKVKVTGQKERNKIYYSYSGYQGGLKAVNVGDQRAKDPTRLIENAVRGMLPKNPLGRAMFRKLKVYTGSDHQHAAQAPKPLQL